MSKFYGTIIFMATASAALLFFAIFPPSFLTLSYDATIYQESLAGAQAPIIFPSFQVTHLDTPEPVKAIYVTACVAGSESWRKSLKNLINTTELNAVVIDIKDFTGIVSFPRDIDYGAEARKGCIVGDMREFIDELHKDGIYVIGRISVFQDPTYTSLFPELAVRKISDGGVWKDHKGLSFIDVGAKPYWDYIVEISREAYALGFDELNYDYVRYPSDGNMKDASHTWTASTTTKARTLESFFAYLYSNLRETGAVLSVDLFGMTTTVKNGMGIGQVLENTLPYFDYIAPMVYPSHYPKTWNGFANPAKHPYEVIKIAMSAGVEREKEWNIANGLFSLDESGATTTPPSKLRPWLQDFDLGATYGVDEVRAQMQAAYDVGLNSWMLWSAANRYTEEALLPE